MEWEVLRDRVVADVGVLARADMGLQAFAEEAMRSLQRAVPHEGWSLYSLDPRSLMPSGVRLPVEAGTGSTPHDRTWARLEYGHEDPTSILSMVQNGDVAVAVHEVTGGEISRSPRMRELMSPVLGCTDELRALATDGHNIWGAFSLQRRGGHFEGWEVELVEALCPLFARAVRSGVRELWTDRADPGREAFPTMLVLDGLGDVVLASPGDVEGLDPFGLGSTGVSGTLLVSLTAVAAAMQATEGTHHPTTRVRLADGRWCTIHATLLRSDQSTFVGVTVTESRPREMLPLIIDALQMTRRERDVLALVVCGADTRAMAEQLHMSGHTVQGHLKAIFAKAGVHSRRELTALALDGRLGVGLH